MNGNGQPFLIQIGGHAPIDETWVASTEGFTDDAGPKREREFVLAAKTIESLAKVKFTRRFHPEYRTLLHLAPLVASARVIDKIEEGGDQEISSPKLLASSPYRHKVEIHDQSCCFGLGRHGATLGKLISSSGVTNHSRYHVQSRNLRAPNASQVQLDEPCESQQSRSQPCFVFYSLQPNIRIWPQLQRRYGPPV